jgi:hypothetical protein
MKRKAAITNCIAAEVIVAASHFFATSWQATSLR